MRKYGICEVCKNKGIVILYKGDYYCRWVCRDCSKNKGLKRWV